MVIDSYRTLLDQFEDVSDPYRMFTVQFFFLSYLLVGQVLLLGLWRLVERPFRASPPSRSRNVLFAFYLLICQVGLFFGWPALVDLWLGANPIRLADVLVTLHLGFVLGVVLALVLILVGWPLGWHWTGNFWFRLLQLLAIEIVAGQAIVHLECPLTSWERELRGGPGHLHDLATASPLGRFCNDVLYLRETPILTIVYASVALLVLLTWILCPPRFPWRTAEATPRSPDRSARTPDGSA